MHDGEPIRFIANRWATVNEWEVLQQYAQEQKEPGPKSQPPANAKERRKRKAKLAKLSRKRNRQ